MIEVDLRSIILTSVAGFVLRLGVWLQNIHIGGGEHEEAEGTEADDEAMAVFGVEDAAPGALEFAVRDGDLVAFLKIDSCILRVVHGNEPHVAIGHLDGCHERVHLGIGDDEGLAGAGFTHHTNEARMPTLDQIDTMLFGSVKEDDMRNEEDFHFFLAVGPLMNLFARCHKDLLTGGCERLRHALLVARLGVDGPPI